MEFRELETCLEEEHVVREEPDPALGGGFAGRDAEVAAGGVEGALGDALLDGVSGHDTDWPWAEGHEDMVEPPEGFA